MIQGQIYTGAMMDIVKVMAGTINIENVDSDHKKKANKIIGTALGVIDAEITRVAAEAAGIQTDFKI